MTDPIPLVRPYIPQPEEWLTFFQKSRDAGVFSNFGPCERLATTRLNEVTGKSCVLTSSGTAALQAIIVECTGKDEVVAIPDFTFRATHSAVRCAGHNSYAIACGYNGLPHEDSLVGGRNFFDAFVVTAPFGSDPEFERYDAIADRIDRPVFYDCAGGWGLDFRRTKNPVAISFHATKNLPIGEGGAVLLADEDETWLTRPHINFAGDYGFNGKMDEIHAAILLAQLQPANLLYAAQRTLHLKTMMKFYMDKCPSLDSAFSDGAPSLCAVGYEGYAAELIKHLNAAGIMAKRGYYPLLAGRSGSDPGLFKVVCLPAAVSVDEAHYIATKINEFGGE